MKKLLGIVVLGLLLSSNAFAEQLICKVKKAYKCSYDKCTEYKSEIVLKLNTDNYVYERSDSKGSDKYDAKIYKSGTYIIAEIQGSTFLKIELTDDLMFVEVAHLGLESYNSFGNCQVL